MTAIEPLSLGQDASPGRFEDRVNDESPDSRSL